MRLALALWLDRSGGTAPFRLTCALCRQATPRGFHAIQVIPDYCLTNTRSAELITEIPWMFERIDEKIPGLMRQVTVIAADPARKMCVIAGPAGECAVLEIRDGVVPLEDDQLIGRLTPGRRGTFEHWRGKFTASAKVGWTTRTRALEVFGGQP